MKLLKTFKQNLMTLFPDSQSKIMPLVFFTLGFLCLPFGLNNIYPFHMKTQFPRVPRFSLSFHTNGIDIRRELVRSTT